MRLTTANNLMTDDLRKELPALGATREDDNPVVRAKYFDPCGSWTWYVLEFDGCDTFYGIVDGFEREFGCFSLRELQSVRNRLGLGMERDLYFTPAPVKDILDKLRSAE